MYLDTAVKNSMFGYQNTSVWKSIRKSNTELYYFYCLLFTFTFTVQFKNVPELNILCALFTISKVSETVLPLPLACVTLLDVLYKVQGDLTLQHFAPNWVSCRLTRHLTYVLSFHE